MTRQQLEHAIRAACAVSGDNEVFVIGSQSVLGEFPEAPEELRQSIEADIVPVNHPEMANAIDGALGELSRFHNQHGFYVHGLTLSVATLPDGWQSRAIPIRNDNTRNCTGLCLCAADLAASKLAAFREKDRDFVRALLGGKLVSEGAIVTSIGLLPVSLAERARLATWIRDTALDA